MISEPPGNMRQPPRARRDAVRNHRFSLSLSFYMAAPATPRDFSQMSLSSAPRVGADGATPPEVADRANVAFDSFATNLSANVWASAKVEIEKDGLRIRSELLSGASESRRFLTEFALNGVTAEQVFDALLCYENRIQWDSGLDHPAWLKRWQGAGGEETDVICYCIKPVTIVGLPVISARGLMDVRTLRRGDGVLTCCSYEALADELPADAGVAEWRALCEKKGFVHARNLPGGGVRLVERGVGVVEVAMIAATEFGGMVPAKVLNGATGKVRESEL